MAWYTGWRSAGRSNTELVNNLRSSGLIQSKRVYEAMEKVDRAHFADYDPYVDTPQRIGYGQTISAPHMHANAASALEAYAKPGAKVLDVGSGSGYLTAVFARMVQPGGKVVGIEHLPELTELSKKNLAKDPEHRKMMDDESLVIVNGDGRKGYPDEAPFDCIHVGAAAPSMPKDLVQQLKSPGKMFVPVVQSGGSSYAQSQYIVEVTKDEEGNVETKRLYQVMYVPLCDRPED